MTSTTPRRCQYLVFASLLARRIEEAASTAKCQVRNLAAGIPLASHFSAACRGPITRSVSSPHSYPLSAARFIRDPVPRLSLLWRDVLMYSAPIW